MSRSPLNSWYDNPFTGLFQRWGPLPQRPHDPDVCCWAGVLPRWGRTGIDLAVGGAGWTTETAELAALGEAIERWQVGPAASDRLEESSWSGWRLNEPAVEPDRWVLFHPEQYTMAGFPFAPLRPETVCRWVACRKAGSGEPCWVPAALVYLDEGSQPPLAPGLSTGLSAGRIGDPVLLRGLQEVLERDTLVGAWWGRYALEEHDWHEVQATIHHELRDRLNRPNLRWQGWRIATPYSAHVTVVAVSGEDREGFCFSIGSACRETRSASWTKAILEAVQGRYHVRHLLGTPGAIRLVDGVPIDFAGHAVYYSLYPSRLARTPLSLARPPGPDPDASSIEGLAELMERLGPAHPVLFRLLTPPALSAARTGWIVARVLVPGMQPLHGSHAWPFLGGPLWAPRTLAAYHDMVPHPFP